jgi:putative tryptophan/tyrosine transport system substrate-binding protein
MSAVGFLRSASLADATHLVTAFRQGLEETGYMEGQNVAIEYRSAEDHHDRLPAMVADLIRQGVAMFVGNTPSALAAKVATTTIRSSSRQAVARSSSASSPARTGRS